MARKKIETIIGVSNDPDNKLLVQKSLPLFSLWRSDLTLPEFKILDSYLARIDSHKPEKRRVQLEKGQLESILGVKQLRTIDLKERLSHLMGHVVEVKDPTSPKGFKLITLFEEAEAVPDPETGLWIINLECTQKAMKYFFNIENLGYLRYKLRCITNLTSRYSYILFVYLESNRYRRTWDVDLDELRKILACETEETYKEYKRFNDLILKKAQKELLAKTECRFIYEPVKRGRKVVGIKFTLETLKDIALKNADQIEGQMSISDYIIDSNTIEDENMYFNTACNGEFSKEQVDVLIALIKVKSLPKHPDGENAAVYQYLDLMYKKLSVAERTQANKGKKITNRFNYLQTMIRQDKITTDKGKAEVVKPKNGFHTMESRDYSREEMIELEKQLLNRK